MNAALLVLLLVVAVLLGLLSAAGIVTAIHDLTSELCTLRMALISGEAQIARLRSAVLEVSTGLRPLQLVVLPSPGATPSDEEQLRQAPAPTRSHH